MTTTGEQREKQAKQVARLMTTAGLVTMREICEHTEARRYEVFRRLEVDGFLVDHLQARGRGESVFWISMGRATYWGVTTDPDLISFRVLAEIQYLATRQANLAVRGGRALPAGGLSAMAADVIDRGRVTLLALEMLGFNSDIQALPEVARKARKRERWLESVG